MNERQANAQHRLSTGRPPGQDSLVVSDGKKDRQNPEEMQSEEMDGEKTITKSTFILMIGVGLILDFVGLLPLLGWFLSSLVLILIYLKLGVKFHLKNVLKLGGCDLIKAIPPFSIVPAFTLAIILNLGPMIEGLGDSIPGGEAIANKVRKAMVMTKK